MPCFKFDLGNSSVGPLGMVARVTAPDKPTALRLLQERIENTYPGQDVNLHLGDAPVEYVNVYVNAEAITLDDIDDAETEEDETDEESPPQEHNTIIRSADGLYDYKVWGPPLLVGWVVARVSLATTGRGPGRGKYLRGHAPDGASAVRAARHLAQANLHGVTTMKEALAVADNSAVA